MATIPTPLVSDIAVLIGLYSAARWSRSVVVRYAVLAGGLVAAVVAAFRWPVITTATGVAVYFAFLAGLAFLAWLIGDLTGRRARYLAGIEAQNLALLRERWLPTRSTPAGRPDLTTSRDTGWSACSNGHGRWVAT